LLVFLSLTHPPFLPPSLPSSFLPPSPAPNLSLRDGSGRRRPSSGSEDADAVLKIWQDIHSFTNVLIQFDDSSNACAS